LCDLRIRQAQLVRHGKIRLKPKGARKVGNDAQNVGLPGDQVIDEFFGEARFMTETSVNRFKRNIRISHTGYQCGGDPAAKLPMRGVENVFRNWYLTQELVLTNAVK
jgi:hypothetical protein